VYDRYRELNSLNLTLFDPSSLACHNNLLFLIEVVQMRYGYLIMVCRSKSYTRTILFYKVISVCVLSIIYYVLAQPMHRFALFISHITKLLTFFNLQGHSDFEIIKLTLVPTTPNHGISNTIGLVRHLRQSLTIYIGFDLVTSHGERQSVWSLWVE
jgi:hypothetical protein